MVTRKLNLILKSKSTSEFPAWIGDLVQVFVKLPIEKWGKLSNARPVLSYDKHSGTITVLGQNGLKIKAAIEDFRFDITEKNLS